MLLHRAIVIPLAAALALPAGAALSQESAPSAAPSSLVFYFDAGSAKVRPKDVAMFDQASRLYRDGKPLVMVVTGSTDSVGTAAGNLRAVAGACRCCAARASRAGHSDGALSDPGEGRAEPPVPTAPGAAEPRNRRAELTWR